MVCRMPETLYCVTSHLFLIDFFSTLSIPLFIITPLNVLLLYIQIFITFSSFIKLLLVFHVPVTCLALNHNSSETWYVFLFVYNVTRNRIYVTALYINSLMAIFGNIVLTLSSVILLYCEISNWFLFFVLFYLVS